MNCFIVSMAGLKLYRTNKQFRFSLVASIIDECRIVDEAIDEVCSRIRICDMNLWFLKAFESFYDVPISTQVAQCRIQIHSRMNLGRMETFGE